MDEPKTDQHFSLQGIPAMAAVTDKAIIATVERFFRRPEIHGNLDYLSNRSSGFLGFGLRPVPASGFRGDRYLSDYNELCKSPSYDAYLARRAREF